MVPTDIYYTATMGSPFISFYDILMLNMHYNCTGIKQFAVAEQNSSVNVEELRQINANGNHQLNAKMVGSLIHATAANASAQVDMVECSATKGWELTRLVFSNNSVLKDLTTSAFRVWEGTQSPPNHPNSQRHSRKPKLRRRNA